MRGNEAKILQYFFHFLKDGVELTVHSALDLSLRLHKMF
jgi:hypothetical protein